MENMVIRNNQFNIGHICTRQQCDTGLGGKVAMRWLSATMERTDYTFGDLERESNRFANILTTLGFKPGEIYFDSTVFPLAIDMPMEPNVPGYTYRAFETIKKIKSDPKMKGVHCSLGISNSVRDLPGRKIGVCRAYVAKAMEYGLDAGIVNVAHHYGQVAPDAELLELVDAYAKMDGSAESMNKAMELMGKFCSDNRKPAD